LQVDLFSPAESLGASLTAPAGVGNPGWSTNASAVPVHRFRNGGAPDAFSILKVVVLKQGRVLKVIGRSAGLALTGPQGAVGIRIVTGSLRSCALFGGTTVRRDEAGRFLARAASATGLTDCSNTSLGGAEPPAPVCGDGVQNQSSEECDGNEVAQCGGPSSCRPAGFAGECQCCSNGGPGTQPTDCCNASVIFVPTPDGGTCHATRCDAPFSCSATDVCQPDGSCCAPVGGACRLTLLGGLSLGPCCSGLECRTLDINANVVCCVADGGSCASDAECCTTHCTPSGTCQTCRTTGTACGSVYECCSLSCSAGTCDACGPSGGLCFEDATCCSSSCNEGTSTCN